MEVYTQLTLLNVPLFKLYITSGSRRYFFTRNNDPI